MAKIVSFINEKGGVGKTTSTNLIASCLKSKGHKVLCIDFDPQGHLSFSMGADTREHSTIYDVLKRKAKPQYAVQKTDVTDIIPANAMLKSIEREFTLSGNEKLLSNAIQQISGAYHYILIDSPPELGLLSANALIASDIVLIPCLPDGYSLKGVVNVHETISRIKSAFNPKLKVGGIFFVRYYPREKLSQSAASALNKVAATLKIPVLNTKIRHSNIINSATSVNQLDVFAQNFKSNAISDYKALVNELLKKGVL